MLGEAYEERFREKLGDLLWTVSVNGRDAVKEFLDKVQDTVDGGRKSGERPGRLSRHASTVSSFCHQHRLTWPEPQREGFVDVSFWGQHRFEVKALRKGQNEIRLVITGNAANIYENAGIAFGLDGNPRV